MVTLAMAKSLNAFIPSRELPPFTGVAWNKSFNIPF